MDSASISSIITGRHKKNVNSVNTGRFKIIKYLFRLVVSSSTSKISLSRLHVECILYRAVVFNRYYLSICFSDYIFFY